MTFTGESPQERVARIDALLTRDEALELHRRELDAAQLSNLVAMRAAVYEDGPVPDVRSLDYRDVEFNSLCVELAASRKITPVAARALFEQADMIVHQYPNLFRLLETRQVPLSSVKVVTYFDHTFVTGDTDADNVRRAAYEADILEHAVMLPTNELRNVAKRLAAKHTREQHEARHREARKRRHVRVSDVGDDMAEFIAMMTVTDAYALKNRIDQWAKHTALAEARAETDGTLGDTGPGSTSVAGSPGAADTGGNPDAGASPGAGGAGEADPAGPVVERRTFDQIRSDTVRDLVLQGVIPDGPVTGHDILAKIQVFVPGQTVGLEAVEGVAELAGHGPISDTVAREIAAHTPKWDQATVDQYGQTQTVKSRIAPPGMRRMVIARDLHCRIPGCRVPAIKCELDHSIPWADGGPTSPENLACLCVGHHLMKTHTDWTITQLGNGTLQLGTPTGREYVTRPPSQVRFRKINEPEPEPEPEPGSGPRPGPRSGLGSGQEPGQEPGAPPLSGSYPRSSKPGSAGGSGPPTRADGPGRIRPGSESQAGIADFEDTMPF